MSLEQRINLYLNRFPQVKKHIKRLYQLVMYSLSKKIKYEGNIIRVSPDDGKEYFFGYYDKSPWDISGRYMLCMRANDTWSDVAPKESADIILIDTQNNNAVRKLATTKSWNVQQGCMAQWLGPNFNKQIIYNDFRNGKYCSVILDIKSMNERILPLPVYTVSQNGKVALSLLKEHFRKNKDLKYGLKAHLYSFCYFCFTLMPGRIRQVFYQWLR